LIRSGPVPYRSRYSHFAGVVWREQNLRQDEASFAANVDMVADIRSLPLRFFFQ
jgi:hypothetical protein